MSETAPEQWWVAADEYAEVSPEWLRTPSPGAGPNFLRQPLEQSGHDQQSRYDPPPAAEHAPPPPLTTEAAYDAWDRTRSDLRPLPSLGVVAGHARKKYEYTVNEGDLRAFETAHGIPLETLELNRDSEGRVVGVQEGDGRRWQPERYRTPTHLIPEVLEVVALMEKRDPNTVETYQRWDSLPLHQRPAPNGKVVAGFAQETVVRHLRSGDVDRFADKHRIPRADISLTRNAKSRHVNGVVLRPGAPWPPTAWGVPSEQGAVAGNPLGTAAHHTSPGRGHDAAPPAFPDASAPTSPGPVRSQARIRSRARRARSGR
ncbi:hypothetical protein [Streptomyces axinellae]|uniref:Uncharacterized protein n=1 Tax=Streptomyces axinellae TaxID=552788 RepID=A0ABP6D745_9ACTN